MANDLLQDLIRQVQRATRAESGLSQFDLSQPLPALPPISDTVASLDPSPPELRCKNCKGRLLRGLQSVICVYCGRSNDVVRDPICFKDTVAYRWLLASLHLDGSEIVEPPLERGDSGRGQSRPDDEIRVSDLLDFKIIWPAEERRTENASSQKVEKGALLKFPGIDLDNFFHDSRGLDAEDKPEEFQVTRNDVTAEINTTSTNNLSFFETIASSKSAVQSSNDQENDDFSGWEADFQSSDTGMQFDGFKSSDQGVNSTLAPANDQEISKQEEAPPNGSSVDISSHLDTVFGSVKDDSAASPSISDWTSQHTWDEFNPAPTLETKQPDPVVTTEVAVPGDNSSIVDLSDQLDSMFGSQQEMSSFTSGPSKSDWTSDDIWDSLSSKTYQAPADTVGHIDALPQDPMNNPSSISDWFQLDQWQKSTNEPGNNVMTVDEVATGGWDDFTSSVPIMTNNAPEESHMQSIAASERTSESLFFNTENSMEEIDFGSFSQADLIRAPSGKEGVSIQSTANSERSIDVNRSTGESLVLTDYSVDANKVSTQTREDVEMLLSEMHDLSFMLEDKLSIPPKPDGFNSF